MCSYSELDVGRVQCLEHFMHVVGGGGGGGGRSVGIHCLS